MGHGVMCHGKWIVSALSMPVLAVNRQLGCFDMAFGNIWWSRFYVLLYFVFIFYTEGRAMTQINIRLDDELRGGIPVEVTTRPAAFASADATGSREKSSFGGLKHSANPSLIEREEGAWATATEENSPQP
jgi:hypothetical protein